MGFPGVKAVIFDLDDTLTVHQAAYDDSYLVIAMEIAGRHDIDPTAAASSMPALFLRAGETTPQSGFLRRIGIGGRDLLWGEAGDRSTRTGRHINVAQRLSRVLMAFRPLDPWHL